MLDTSTNKALHRPAVVTPEKAAPRWVSMQAEQQNSDPANISQNSGRHRHPLKLQAENLPAVAEPGLQAFEQSIDDTLIPGQHGCLDNNGILMSEASKVQEIPAIGNASDCIEAEGWGGKQHQARPGTHSLPTERQDRPHSNDQLSCRTGIARYGEAGKGSGNSFTQPGSDGWQSSLEEPYQSQPQLQKLHLAQRSATEAAEIAAQNRLEQSLPGATFMLPYLPDPVFTSHKQERKPLMRLLEVQPVNHYLAINSASQPYSILLVGSMSWLADLGAGGKLQRAQQVAAACRASCDLLKGAPKSTRNDPFFMDNYYKSSRLHFIGTWKARIEALADKTAGPDPYSK